ncbi:MAG: alcohol dehydrogenase catalytic domain-containing protein [Acidobacteriota bacterium]|nr:alcohol dehydrogenase catalytic domain-containing protein [Acidobacteriota bacterium]
MGSMKVAVYHRNDDIRLEERERPSISNGELLVRVEASGICGSDVMEWYRQPQAPLVLGHEISGIVESVGEGVTDFAVGDRVCTTHHVPCGNCRDCRRGSQHVCETLHRTRFDPGGFSEFVRLPEINVRLGTFKLPNDVSFVQASFVEPLACVIRGQRLASVGVDSDDSVLVLGSGISGILHLQWAGSRGIKRLFAADVHPYRMEMATRFSAQRVFDARDPIVDAVRDANNGRLVDRVVICTGADAAFAQALRLVAPGGSILVFATPAPGRNADLPLNDLWKRGISLVFSYAGPPTEMRQALDAIATREIDVDGMVSHRLSLAETGQGFQLTANAGESLKVIVEPHRLHPRR